MMKAGSRAAYAAPLLLFFLAIAVETGRVSAGGRPPWGWPESCPPWKCLYRRVRCPMECPYTHPWKPKAKRCHLDCHKCEAYCENPPDCKRKGSGCGDPRFVGGDGLVFYFHGRKNEHFTLVSEPRFQINSRFIGHRPTGRTRDFTWIQALGFLFGSHRFTIEAIRAESWDDAVDHVQLSYDGQPLELPEAYRSFWSSPDGVLTVERAERTNSVIAELEGMVEASINVVPVTKEDDRIHSYHIPDDDCFAHLEVQFSFHGLSKEVEGVLGRTYQPDYESPVKRGVDMPVLGGADKYSTPSLLSPHCTLCVFAPEGNEASENLLQVAEN